MTDYIVRQDTFVHIIATCQEAQHYPIYDSANPEHDPNAPSTKSPRKPASIRRGSSRSPAKAPLWKRSPSIKRPPASARARSRLQGFADTLRAKANVFYEAQKHSTEDESMPQEALIPPTPGSAKSISSRKSVRFRSGHSVIGSVRPQSSPITIPIKTPPSLPMVNISSTPVFEITSDEEKNLGQIAGAPQNLSLHVPSACPLKKTSRPQFSIETEDTAAIIQALTTPMPGTNLPLEDPFDDNAVASHSDHLTSRIPTCPIGSEQGYICDHESNTEMTEVQMTGVPPTIKCAAQSMLAPSPEQKVSTKPGTSSLVRDYQEQSSNNSPLAAQRTLRRANALPLTFKQQISTSRLPSETQYDADIEPSDGSEAQKETIKDIAVKHESDETMMEDSQFGVDLFRCKTHNQLRSRASGTIPCLTLKNPSSAEVEELAFPSAAGSEASMHSADYAGKASIGFEASAAPDTLETKQKQGRLNSINLRPKPRSENTEDADPALSREPSKVCGRLLSLVGDKENHQKLEVTALPVKTHDRMDRVCSTTSANSVSPFHCSATVSSISPPHTHWQPNIDAGTDEDIDTGRSEHYSSFARDILEEVRQ